MILFYLFVDGIHRFSDLKHKIPEISYQQLSTQLRQLESSKIIEREAFREIPARVEYCLSSYGKTLQPIADAMCSWGMDFIEKQNKTTENK